MIYFLTALSLFTFLTLCGATSRLKKAEEHIEIIRVALDRHLTDGADYRSTTTVQSVRQAQMLAELAQYRAAKSVGRKGDEA
ncbi:hypothetical protein N6H05_23760 [Sphingobium sp. WTD-1]|uniref:hypothetical protein n=1 Tax=Sphingobium sp. WTD-1 TaxID=2979467 RepID=UPI0024DE1591|nr:hypothetical protein [Sphingobium sp. WTD-1]WIA55996.1 hypothetical protein N6H05_23760 [Sphingobium sp. WTD-1]